MKILKITRTAGIMLGMLLTFSLPLMSQDFVSARLDSLRQRQSVVPAQKLFVRHDKPSYVAGETIWLSTFLVDGTYHQLNTLSNTIYIDLVNAQDETVIRRMLHSPLGISWGQMQLPDSLPAGNYHLVGYTHYMKNAGPEFFFKKSVPVYNASILPPPPDGQRSIDLQFFAESGQFLIGIENRLAFRAIGPDGLPVAVSGIIMDEKGGEVVPFTSVHDGMGEIKLTPVPGKSYTARFSGPDSVISNVALPPVEFSGYVLHVSREGDHYRCFIYRNTSDGGNEIGLVAQSRGVERFAAKTAIGNSAEIRIPVADLPTGITQITIFDGNGIPRGERLVFVNHNKALDIDISTNQETYGSRERVEVNASVTDPSVEKDTMEVFFSVSVFDRQAYPERHAPAADIVSYLYLSSDLSGYIHEPGYYFRDTTSRTLFHADLLMQTQGWRRFLWEDPAVPSEKFRHEKGVPVRGRITRAMSKKPYARGNISILNANGGIATTISEENGEFYNDELVFYDTTQLVIETESKKGNQSEFNLDIYPPAASPAFSLASLPDLYGSADDYIQRAGRQVDIDEGYIATRDAIMLDEVRIEETRIKEEVIKYYGMPDRSITTENLPKSSPNIIESIRGRFAGVLISGSPLQPTISIRGGGTPLFLLDGIVVNQYTILNIPPDQIESVDLIKGNNAAIFGAQGANGVLAFYTKRGYQDYGIASLGMNTVRYDGFSPVREFYNPRYDVQNDRNDLPDMRTTLFWSPLLKTAPDGSLTFDFFTADPSGEYDIVLQALSLEGNPGSAVRSFRVTK